MITHFMGDEVLLRLLTTASVLLSLLFAWHKNLNNKKFINEVE